MFALQGPIIQRPISANPGLNFNPGLIFLFIKSIFSDNFLFFYRVTNY